MALVGNITAILLSVFLTSHVHCSQEHIAVNSVAQLAAIKQHDNGGRRALIRRGDDESKEEAVDQAGAEVGTIDKATTANASSLPHGWYCPQGVVSGSRGSFCVTWQASHRCKFDDSSGMENYLGSQQTFTHVEACAQAAMDEGADHFVFQRVHTDRAGHFDPGLCRRQDTLAGPMCRQKRCCKRNSGGNIVHEYHPPQSEKWDLFTLVPVRNE